MASSISPWFIASYDAALHGVPQHGSRLKDTVRIKSGVVGNSHRFPAVGKTIARTRLPYQPIETSTAQKAKPQANLRNAEDFSHLDEYEVSQTNVTAAPAYARNARLAVERACDQRIIDAWIADSNEAIGTGIATNADTFKRNPDNPDSVEAASNKVTPGKIAKSMTSLMMRGVGTGDMLTFAYSQAHFQNIVQIDQLLSRDYSERGMMATGTPPPIYGLQWRGIETRQEGGIASTDGWIYAKESTGLAEGTVMRMRVTDWLPQLQLWQIGAKLNIGATTIDRNMFNRLTLSV